MINPVNPTVRGFVFRTLAAVSCFLFLTAAGVAAADAKHTFDLPAGDAEKMLKLFTTQSGEQILYPPTKVSGITTNAVKGELTTPEALDAMLTGTELVALRDAQTGGYAIRREKSVEQAEKNGLRAALKNSDRPEAKKGDQVLELSPFSVNGERNRGYQTANSLSGVGIDTSIAKLPQTLQVVNAELLQDLGAGSGDLISALQMAVSGVVRRGTNNGDDQYMWGFRLNFSMRDGVPVGFTNPLGVLYDVDRIEAVKGPAAALFGQASFVGGVINYVPRSPSSVAKYSLEATVGSYGQKTAVFHATGPVTNQLRYRVDVGWTDKDGQRLFQFYKDKFVGAGLEYDLGPKTIFSLEGHWANADRMNTYTIVDAILRDGRYAQPSLALGDRTINSPADGYLSTNDTVTAKLKTVLPGDISSVTSFNWTYVNDDINRTNNAVSQAWDVSNQLISRVNLNFYVNEKNWFFQQVFNKQFKTGPVSHSINVGADSRWRDHFETVTFYSIDPTNATPSFSLLNPDYSLQRYRPAPEPAGVGAERNKDSVTKERSRFTGAYAQDVISFWNDRISVLGSYRYSEIFQTGGTPIVGFSSNSGPQTLSAGSQNTLRYGLTVEPISNVMAYFNHGESFIFNQGTDYLLRPLIPSVANNNEIGIKASAFDGALTVTVSRFDIEVTNVRLTEAIGVTQNGSQFNQGWDVALNFNQRIGNGTANAIATYYQGNLKNELGQKPQYPANNTYSFWGSYQFNSGALNGLKFGLGTSYTGERVGPTLAAAAGSLPTRIAPWTNTRAMLGYTWKNVTFQLNVDNIADHQEIESWESNFWVTTDPGRVFRFTAVYRF